MKDLLRRKLTLQELPVPKGPAAPSSPESDPGWTPPLDLLRERRRELNLEPVSGLLVQRPALLRRGLLFGVLLLGASAGLCGLLLLWHQWMQAQMSQLEPYEQQVETLTKDVALQGKALRDEKKYNQELVKRLTEVRSSSALLADLQLRVPEGVQITAVQMQGSNQVQVEGIARDPMAFGRVNAMELVLRNSPLFAASNVKLGKVERVEARQVEVKGGAGAAKKAEATTKLELPSAVKFAMTATLSPLAANRLLAVMEGLQAEGMARRLELLQREGLLQ